MTRAEQFCKLNGIEPTYKFLIGLPSEEIYSTFTDAKNILEVMMKRNDYNNFLCKVGAIIPIDNGIEIIRYIEYLDIFYILNPDKLLDEAILFCEEATK